MVDWQKVKEALWRTFYSTSFTIVFLVLVALIIMSPADAVYQGYRARRWIDIIVVAGAYLLTGVLAILLYTSRLYSNRSALRDIPKTYMPVVYNEDLPGWRVHALIEERLARSAVTAFLARPRAERIEVTGHRGVRERVADLVQVDLAKLEERWDNGEDSEPPWGKVAHPGWTSSAPARDLPANLHFETVIKELPDLIEAKAVSLVLGHHPSHDGDSASSSSSSLAKILHRPPHAGMRQYLTQLTAVGVFPDPSSQTQVKTFLAAYEKSRFHPNPLSEPDFRFLMNSFADLLATMQPPRPDLEEGSDESSSISFENPISTSSPPAVETKEDDDDDDEEEDGGSVIRKKI